VELYCYSAIIPHDIVFRGKWGNSAQSIFFRRVLPADLNKNQGVMNYRHSILVCEKQREVFTFCSFRYKVSTIYVPR